MRALLDKERHLRSTSKYAGTHSNACAIENQTESLARNLAAWGGTP